KVPRQMVTLGPALTLQNANRSSRSSSSSHFSRTDVTTFAPDSLAVAGTLFARGPLCRQDLARGDTETAGTCQMEPEPATQCTTRKSKRRRHVRHARRSNK